MLSTHPAVLGTGITPQFIRRPYTINAPPQRMKVRHVPCTDAKEPNSAGHNLLEANPFANAMLALPS